MQHDDGAPAVAMLLTLIERCYHPLARQHNTPETRVTIMYRVRASLIFLLVIPQIIFIHVC